MSDKWDEVIDDLTFIRAGIQELLRRIPEARCQYCGQGRDVHTDQNTSPLFPHEFVPL